MNKDEIAAILEDIHTLLQLKEENPFKVRAYQMGARALEALDEPLDQLIKEGALAEVRGIGAAISGKVTELYETGQLKFYDDLRKSVKPGLIDMLDVPGLGPKKIVALHKQLGIDSLSKLTEACEDESVAGLKGFGKKTQENILRGIENLEKYSQRTLWWDASRVSGEILESLRSLSCVEEASAAGSFRRKLETVGDLDFLVGSDDSASVMDHFVSLSGVEQVTAHGETKSSVRLKSGMQADLRVVPVGQFYSALHHFTGSKNHNILMRQRALSMGYSLSEWGLVTSDEAKEPIFLQSEEAIFEALNLHYIPPELREGLDEVEYAEDHETPRLLQDSDIKGVFHNHTVASDGRNTLEEMASAAEALGWEYLGIADHSKSSVQANGLSVERLMAQVDEVKRLNASKQFKVRIFSGTECDILKDGSLDFENEVLTQLDYVVASVHSAFTLSEEEMTTRIIRAIENPSVTMLGHLTGRLLLKREPYKVDVAKVIDAAIANNVIIEINANPRRLDMNWRHWRKASEKGLLASINPDAHSTEQLLYYSAGVNVARKGWLTSESVINTRSLVEVRPFLQKSF